MEKDTLLELIKGVDARFAEVTKTRDDNIVELARLQGEHRAYTHLLEILPDDKPKKGDK